LNVPYESQPLLMNIGLTTPNLYPYHEPPPSLNGLLHRVVSDAALLLHANRCALFQFDVATGDLALVASLGAISQQPRIALQKGIIGWVATQLQPVAIPDVARDARYDACDGPRSGSLVCTPLIDGKTLLGVLAVASDKSGFLDQRSLPTLGVLTQYATLALSRLQHAQSDGLPLRQLAILVDAAQAITSLLEPSEVFANIITSMHHVIEYEHAIIFAYDETDDALHVMAGRNVRGTPLRQQQVSMKETTSLSVRVAQIRQPCIYQPSAQSPMTGRITEAFLDGEDMAMLCIPLLSKETLRGVVTLARRHEFKPDDMRTMTNLAPLIATAIENTALYVTVKTEREQLAAIITSTTDGICVIDATLHIIQANAAMTKLTGQPLEAIIGSRCGVLFGSTGPLSEQFPQGITHLMNAVTDAVKSGRGTPVIEYEFPERPNLPARQVLVSIAPISRPDCYYAVIVARDITELRAIDRMKARFLQTISHEIRSPLQALNSYLDMTLKGVGGALTAQQQDIVQHARMSSKHMTARVKDLLVLAYQEAGFNSLEIQPVDLYSVINEAIVEVKLLADEQDIIIHPPAPMNLAKIPCDSERLEQVVRNLLNNAIKFTPRAGHIYVTLAIRRNTVEISITDTGCGIAAEYLPYIFDRFYQAPYEQGRQRGKGQGLGLSIVKAIVEQHDGWVTVISTPGQGSTFTVHLPIKTPTDSLQTYI